jgi:hypothetical protein
MGTNRPSVNAPADMTHLHVVEMNEALILGSVRQPELTEAAGSNEPETIAVEPRASP